MKAISKKLSIASRMELQDLQKRFEKVEALLKDKPWFSKDKWIVSQHPFPKTKPDGVTLHVYKRHWFNNEGLGIHFESYLDLNPKKLKKTYLTLHTLHYGEIPGKSIDRKKFSKPLVDSINEEVATWNGYSFRAGKYGLQPFTRFLDASSKQFEVELVNELERLCKRVGPKIDKVLNSLMT
jgi:hypothetical protein